MKELQEYNELVAKLVTQLNVSIELSKKAAEKLQEVLKGYSLTKNHE